MELRRSSPPQATLHRSVAFNRFESLSSFSAKQKTPPEWVAFRLAEDEGFEPPQTESESGVLPLHKSSICGTGLIILYIREKSSPILKKVKIFFRAHFSSQGKGFPARTSSRRKRNVSSSPRSRSMVRMYSSSCWVLGCIRFRSLLPR